MSTTKITKVPHPGKILLEEFLQPRGISQKELAQHLGWTTARLSEIIHAKRGITADSALSLADAFGVTPEYWFNLQMNWDIDQSRKTYVRKKLLHSKKD